MRVLISLVMVFVAVLPAMAQHTVYVSCGALADNRDEIVQIVRQTLDEMEEVDLVDDPDEAFYFVDFMCWELNYPKRKKSGDTILK